MNETIDREARLFEAGNYPEKGIEITESDLDRMVECFNGAPVRVEHTKTPFDGALGILSRIWRIGKSLFGRISFTPEAWALIDKAGARKLSIAITRDKSAITEVSLVNEPAVATAQVFDNTVRLVEDAFWQSNDYIRKEVVAQMNSEQMISKPSETEFSEKLARLETENETLKKQIAGERASARIDALLKSGKITPAVVEFARAILLDGDETVVTFAGESASLSDLFLRFVDAMPRAIVFGESARTETVPGDFSPEHLALFDKLGVNPETAAKYAGR